MKQWISLVAFFAVLLLAAPVSAAPIHVNDLVESTNDYDGKKVEITGEAIGDIMIRGNMGWVNILDQGTGIGIWATPEQLKRITGLGSYDQVGDTVTIIGTFHRACAEHGGETDIHAEQIVLNQAGMSIAHPIQRNKVVLAAVLLPFTLLAYLYDHKKRMSNKV